MFLLVKSLLLSSGVVAHTIRAPNGTNRSWLKPRSSEKNAHIQKVPPFEAQPWSCYGLSIFSSFRDIAV